MQNGQVVLDPSGEIVPQEGYTVVQTEIDFLKSDGDDKLWVSGQVCNYALQVFKARNQKHFEVLVSSREKLRMLAGTVANQLPSNLVDRSIEILERHNLKTLAELLSILTKDDLWVSEVSSNHAARYLVTHISDDLLPLAETQRRLWEKLSLNEPLSKIYRRSLSERPFVLREWLFDQGLKSELGEFPIKLVDTNAELLEGELAQSLRSSRGLACKEFPKATPNKEVYAKATVEYFSHNPSHLSHDTIAIVSHLLSHDDLNKLEALLPQAEILPVTAADSVADVLGWATERYLPFRLLQASQNNCEESDRLAESFANWILHNYPGLTTLDRDESPLNIRTFYTVKRLAEEFWVLWVVVDGLSFLNHQELVRLVSNKSAHLRASENLPLLAVLPTITEKAKFGLTTGAFPQENSSLNWSIKANFLSAFPNGVYAGNSGMTDLAAGLKRETPTVCYWNYTKIDKYHHENIELSFLKHEVGGCLQSLANHINQIVSTAYDINKVAVVICSDHGQVVSRCNRLEIDLENHRVHGRTILMADRQFPHPDAQFFKDDSSETVHLNPTSFRLSEPTAVALKSTYFVDRTCDPEGTIGVHGGLYPEEVVVGMAVLLRQPNYKPVTARIEGEGESGKAGILRLVIDNPNPLILNPLAISIDGISVDFQGDLLVARVAPMSMLELDLQVTEFPQPTLDDDFEVHGELAFEFGDGTRENCRIRGRLTCRSLYKPKNPSLLDRFKK